MAMRQRSYFRRGTAPTFTCQVCDRRTRNPDSDTCCPECWELAGQDNYHNDNGLVPTAEEMEHYEAIVAHAVKRGSNGEKMRASCPYIWRPATA